MSSISEVLKLTVDELRQVLQEKDCDVDGSKAVLQQRYMDYVEAEKNAEHAKLKEMIETLQASLANSSIQGNASAKQAAAPPFVEVTLNEPAVELRPRELRKKVKNLDVRKLLTPFKGNGDSFTMFQSTIRLILRTYEVDEEELKLDVIACLESRAKDWFHSKPSHIELSLEEILLELDRLFNTRLNRVQQRKKFELRHWKENEDFYSYYTDKMILANPLDILDEEMVDYIIDGMSNVRLQSQARLQMFAKPEHLLRAFSKLTESDRGLGRECLTGRKEVYKRDVVSNVPARNFSAVLQDKDKADQKPAPRCYNCGELGHFSTKCEKPKRQYGSCIRCGSTEHKIMDCKEKKPSVHLLEDKIVDGTNGLAMSKVFIKNRESNSKLDLNRSSSPTHIRDMPPHSSPLSTETLPFENDNEMKSQQHKSKGIQNCHKVNNYNSKHAKTAHLQCVNKKPSYLADNNFTFIDADDDVDSNDSDDSEITKNYSDDNGLIATNTTTTTNNNNNTNKINKCDKLNNQKSINTHKSLSNSGNANNNNYRSNNSGGECDIIELAPGGKEVASNGRLLRNLQKGNKKVKSQISLCITETEDEECTEDVENMEAWRRPSKRSQFLQQQQQQQKQQVVVNGDGVSYKIIRSADKETVEGQKQPRNHHDDNDGLKYGKVRENCDNDNNHHHYVGDVEKISVSSQGTLAMATTTTTTSCGTGMGSTIKSDNNYDDHVMMKCVKHRSGSSNSGDGKKKMINESVLNSENYNYLDNDMNMDPYTELELYLEKVKSEITAVFEKLQINEHCETEPIELSSSNNTTRGNQDDSFQAKSSAPETSSIRRRQKLNAITEKIKTIECNKLYDGQHPGWSTVDTMRELNELVQSELSKIRTRDDKECDKAEDNDDSCSDHTQSKYQSLKQKFFLDARKPPMGRNSRIIRNLDWCAGNDLVQKIKAGSQSYDKDSKREMSTQTSPFLGAFKKLGAFEIWNSEESILRSLGTTDDDNKSTSSSICEDGSAVLSSGKSGNSLDSSELDNTESGIGTGSPLKDMDTWSQSQSSRYNTSVASQIGKPPAQNQWIRHDSVTTQTTPNALRSSKINPGVVSLDHEAMDSLSLYDDNNLDEDVDCGKCGDSLFGTDSSSSTTTKIYDDDYDNVIYRDKASTSVSSLSRRMRSLPVSSSYIQGSKIRRPYCLNIDQEPFQSHTTNMVELPSPSSASLHSGHGNILIQELSTKSNSAPLLVKTDKRKDEFLQQKLNLRYSRSQSDRLLAEIEAIEACKWLRAAGFPQYAQMYEDLQFPIDLSNVAKDHSFLEHDPLQSLYRRLVALNRCATMRLDGTHKHGNQNDDSEDDGFALSENWTFQPQNRRWSRIGDQLGLGGVGLGLADMESKILIESRDSSPEPERLKPKITVDTLALPHEPYEVDMEDDEVQFRRTGSERLKDGAKAVLRRLESIKSRRKKRHNRDGVVISGPQVLDLGDMNQRMNDLKCFDLVAMSNPSSPLSPSPISLNSPSSCTRSPVHTGGELKLTCSSVKDGHLSPNRAHSRPNYLQKSKDTRQQSHSTRTSPLHFFTQNTHFLKEKEAADDSSSYCSDGSDSIAFKPRKKPSRARRFLQRGSKIEDTGALSDSECHQGSRKKKYFKDANSNRTEPKSHVTITRGGSLNLGKDSKKYRDSLQSRSVRSRSLIRRNATTGDSDRDEDVILRSKNPTVVRWHSFQSPDRKDHLLRRSSISTVRLSDRVVDDVSIAAMSCGQLQVLRKLALVTLTGCMERYCPTHRSGWNWELPKFIKKIKSSGYKDKKVFGVPLLLVSQRTGQTLPKSIYAAIKWLKLNALDQVGIFRKSGATQRIQKLKAVVETFDSESIAMFDGQQGYDVADMVKQYFRELPECLMTNKMSETFIAIFQHLPVDIRPEAVYAAILLLPDEHREVLNVLLEFLHQVSEHHKDNRMNASNLGMCFGPTLLNTVCGSGMSSPKRRKGTGVPDARELSETLASQNCLSFLIQNFRKIFMVPKDKMAKCNFGYMEESKPVTLEQLGSGLQVHNWRGYMYECTSATIKEGREKSRGWISTSSFDSNVEIAYKKVGDNHPLRLWRCITEIEAPPPDVLQFILKERQEWDTKLLKWKIINQLDTKSEIIQYVCGDQTVTDYCVLRSWRTDLPRGACVIVETSIEHAEAKLMLGGGAVRGVVLASRYLIEACGSGKSRIMHLARVDMKGRSPEWYNKCYGHISSQYLTKIRNSFKHVAQADGPESKV